MTEERKKIGITREGLEELEPYGEMNDEGGGAVMRILMDHARIESDSGLLWDAVESYDSAQLHIEHLATKYDVQYAVGEGESLGVIGVVEPPTEYGAEDEQRYDLYLVD